MDVRFLLLLACFFVSGFAALLYQTAWSRELSFVFGTSELAIVAVLAAYMGGLALGAAAAARYAMRLRRPVLAYGILELAIAVCALALRGGQPDVHHVERRNACTQRDAIVGHVVRLGGAASPVSLGS